jgi:sugar O-acyltransferase (sialic acid O-acetyltransferase NeuD family)
MKRLAIFGCGGFGREVFAAARHARDTDALAYNDYDLVFVADDPHPPVFDTEVITPDRLTEDDRLVIAVGDPAARRAIAERLSHVTAGRMISATTLIGPGCEFGEGAIFSDYTMVTASAKIGRHFECNIYSYVAHDCVIGDFVTFAPKVCCNGNVTIGDGAYIGTGAMIRQGLTIGAHATVGMGAVVTKDVAAGVTVVGNPAREMVKDPLAMAKGEANL